MISNDILEKDTTDCTNYYVCFIDLMGQKDFFKHISSTTPDQATMQHISRVSDGLREIVKYVENRYERNFCAEDDVGVELFSDSILLSLKKHNAGNAKLALWLEMIIKVVYIACGYKLPFRGGIACGVARRSKSRTLYGPVVNVAMELESNCADYPRIVLAGSLANEFEEACIFKQFFTVDSDSATILNYAGDGIISRAEFAKEREMLDGVRKWVADQYGRFCYLDDPEHNRGANPKFARRYVMWLDYLKVEEFRRNAYG